MTAGTEQIIDRAMGGEETLCMTRGLEPAHPPFPLSGWLMGEFSAVVQSLVLTVLDARDRLLAGGFIALKLVGDNDSQDVAQTFQQFAEEAFGGALIAPGLIPTMSST